MQHYNTNWQLDINILGYTWTFMWLLWTSIFNVEIFIWKSLFSRTVPENNILFGRTIQKRKAFLLRKMLFARTEHTLLVWSIMHGKTGLIFPNVVPNWPEFNFSLYKFSHRSSPWTMEKPNRDRKPHWRCSATLFYRGLFNWFLYLWEQNYK